METKQKPCYACKHYGTLDGFDSVLLFGEKLPIKGCVKHYKRISDSEYPNVNNDCGDFEEK